MTSKNEFVDKLVHFNGKLFSFFFFWGGVVGAIQSHGVLCKGQLLHHYHCR